MNIKYYIMFSPEKDLTKASLSKSFCEVYGEKKKYGLPLLVMIAIEDGTQFIYRCIYSLTHPFLVVSLYSARYYDI
jgi:hypothetical protein